MAKEQQDLLDPTPLVAALARHSENGGIAKLRGFVGPAGRNVVRLYEELDMTSFVEFPRDAVLHAQKAAEGRVEIFLAESTDVTVIRRVGGRTTAGEHVRGGALVVFKGSGRKPLNDERCAKATAKFADLSAQLVDEILTGADFAKIVDTARQGKEQSDQMTKYCENTGTY